MATVQNNHYEIARRTGKNYRQLGITSAILVGIVALLVLAYWYSFMYYPRFVTLAGENQEPLTAEIPLEVMPSHPDDLMQFYDEHTASQQERLQNYSVIDVEERTVSITIDDAIGLVEENGIPNWTASAEEDADAE